MAGQQLTNREIPLEKVKLFPIPPIACIAFAFWRRHNRQEYQYLETGLACSDEAYPNGFYLEIARKRIQETLEMARRQNCIVPYRTKAHRLGPRRLCGAKRAKTVAISRILPDRGSVIASNRRFKHSLKIALLVGIG